MRVTRVSVAVALACAMATRGEARQAPAAPATPATPAAAQRPATPATPAPAQVPTAPATPPVPPGGGGGLAADQPYSESIVVSASKVEQLLVDAPATMTLIGPKMLEVAPSNSYSDLLRNVPGLNITQISARDVNVTSRGATGSLATSQLAVLDGRSLYQDFFGFVMWDFMPADLEQIKRIEVIRGPASAVWGANALNGVINVLTKTPREAPGTTVTIGAGAFDRHVNSVSQKAGSLFYVRGSHAAALNDRWSYRVSAGAYASDALARPNGLIPNATNTPYPAYTNSGTRQPKVDARFDYDFPTGNRKLQIAGGFGGTDGIMHTGIGPFDINRGTRMGYGKFDYSQGALHVQAFMNVLDGDATNLVSVDQAAKPIGLVFNTKTFDVEAGDTRVVQSRHVITYGGNLRLNRFHLTLAPGENSRTEGGAYLQDEMILNDFFRVVAGARVDKFSSIDKAVVSPRVALVVKPVADHSVRVSYNRAFRAPSMVNNNLQTTIGTAFPLAAVSPAFGSAIYMVPTTVTGNPDLTEEHIDAYEVAYTANLKGRATLSAAVFYNKFSDEIFFTTTGTWQTAPPGFPSLPGAPANAIWAGVLAKGFVFPSSYTYLNLGAVKSKGLELGVDGALTQALTAYANYSFQPQPVPSFPGLTPAQALGEINLPSKHLANVGMTYTASHAYGTVAISHAAGAFWQDVLDDRFHGSTKPYTLVNATIGARFQNGRYGLALKMTNLGNQQIQQHVFGDVVKRQVVAEFKLQMK